jgi:hypothetical protein
MVSVINPTSEKSIQKLWTTYHVINIIAACTAVPLWFFTPFLTRSIDSNGFHKFFRGFSIAYGLTASATTLILSSELTKLKPKIEALNKREQAEFKHSLASDLFLAQGTNTAIAQFLLSERSSSMSSESSQSVTDLEPIPEGEGNENEQEVTDQVTGSELSSYKVTGTRNQSYEPQLSKEAEQYIDDVVDALEDGLNDTEIVKKVLAMTGRNYQKGKQLLSEIKRFLELEENCND